MKSFSFASLLCLSLLAARPVAAATPAQNAAAEMAAAAHHFLAALTPEQKAQATFELKNDERLNWHFIPKNDRKGVQYKDLTPPQRRLSDALLISSMSARGYSKAVTIMSLEDILRVQEAGKKGGNTRDPERYYFSVFGKPTATGTWGWRLEGHHFSANFTVVAGQFVSATPSFMGSNPGVVKDGPRAGLRVLGTEENLGRQLVKSLDAEQRKQAIYTATAPKDILTAAERKVKPLGTEGVAAAKLTKEQQTLLTRLIREYINRVRSEFAAADWQKIEQAGLDKILFAWAGGTEPGQGHYYRVQGPTFLLEYDNTQNDANHVHAVWRDFANDFGEDILKKHYTEAHGK
ncbi:MAG: DUF3500 domain-containing protein [Verrucomicrobia bacterium]|nr:DUF3500 domain-containing protein [Verrucomicrobiota bacterium]